MEEIAEVYARALFEVAKEHDVLDRVHDELGEFAEALSDDRTLQVFLFSPYFSSEEKRDGVSKIVSDADERVVNFLELLAERHRARPGARGRDRQAHRGPDRPQGRAVLERGPRGARGPDGPGRQHGPGR